jgi:hypothetical protein
MAANGNIVRLEGRVFGSLTVLRREGSKKNFASWRCRCSCGQEVTVRSDKLLQGVRKSCAQNGHRSNSKYPPGMLKKYRVEYSAWRSMHARCENKNATGYINYGRRGIMVCERWNTFGNFIADMGHRPTPKHTLDRIDVNGNYEPSNCRWATRTEQMRNIRNSVYVEMEGGVRVNILDFADKLGIDRLLVRARILRGWSLEAALSTPVRRHPPLGRYRPDTT